MIIYGSSSCGKSLEQELMIKKHIHDGKFPSWVLDIYLFLRGLQLSSAITVGDMGTIVHVLNVPEKLFDCVFEKTHDLGLIFRINCTQRAYYDKHPSWSLGKPKLLGFENNKMEFMIREPRKGENIDEIKCTIEREFL